MKKNLPLKNLTLFSSLTFLIERFVSNFVFFAECPNFISIIILTFALESLRGFV